MTLGTYDRNCQMLEKIRNVGCRKHRDLSALQTSRLPLVIYGVGSYAHDVARFLSTHQVEIDGACVDSEYLSAAGSAFRGKAVIPLAKVDQQFGEYNVLVGFADYRRALDPTKKLVGMKQRFFIDAPNHLDFFDFEYVKAHQRAFEESYDYFQDRRSRETFVAFINAKISGEPDGLWDLREPKQYFNDLVPVGSNETFVDCGAFDGDTILKFREFVGGEYNKIFAFECDESNCEKLRESLRVNRVERVDVSNKGVWSSRDTLRFDTTGSGVSSINVAGSRTIEVDTLDHLLAGETITFLKMDIEGVELQALHGASQLIQRDAPKLAICVYHRPEDLVTIPQLLKSLVPDYRLFLRHHQYVSWETVLYAIPR
jgi:FkbM family methyltransferase